MKQVWRVAHSALLVLCVVLVSVHTAQAVEYGGIGGKPAYPQAGNSRTESIFIHTIEAGKSADDGVLLVNNSSTAKLLEVYAVDSVHSSDGAFACAQKADQSTSVGTWVTLESAEATLAPNETVIVPMKIAVPASADVGESNGCIVIQEKKSQADIQSGMSLSFRTAIRVAVTVPGDITRQLGITFLLHEYNAAEVHVLNIGVKNQGNVSIDANVDTRVSSIFGSTLFEQNGRFPVLRAQTSELHFDLPDTFFGGWYRAALTVSYDAHENASLGVESGESDTVLKSQTDWFFMAPSINGMIIEAGIGLALALLVVLVIVLCYRRRWIRKTWAKYTLKNGEDIKQIATRHVVSWKLLAKVNHLKAPYIVNAGDVIIVPPMETPDSIVELVPKKEKIVSEESESSHAKPAKSKKTTRRQTR